MEIERIIEQLERNAPAIAALVSGLPAEEASWKPSAARWSMLEVVCHLLDEEREDFRVRIELTLRSPAEPWPAIDPPSWVVERGYADRDLDESLRALLEERQRSVSWLRELNAPDWDARYEHPTLGTLRTGDLLASWLAHDFLHLRQLTDLHWLIHAARSAPYGTAYAGEW